MLIKNIVKHFILITKHKYKVFILCTKAGIPVRGLLHDLSKYSPTEFFESVKYYNGKNSPIANCKKENGYSKAWLHHFGRNKHHHEYWYDYWAPEPTPVIPYKYTVEMICDCLAAGMTYQGKNWTKEYQLGYWNNKKGHLKVNEKIVKILDEVYSEVALKGVNKVITKKHLKEVYYKYVK